jgi:hypothetical protein
LIEKGLKAMKAMKAMNAMNGSKALLLASLLSRITFSDHN